MNYLNEKAGIIEFDNTDYMNKISYICSAIQCLSIQNDHLFLFPDILFKKYIFNNLHISWMNTLTIYISNNADYFDAGALAGPYFKSDIISYTSDGNIDNDTIYIINNGQENLINVLLHEMKHLYDHTHFKEIFYEDQNYFLENNMRYDITKYDLQTDASELSSKDIHNILTECMNYANFSERHAYLENINFEIYDFLNKTNKSFYFKTKEQMFPYSSKTLYDIYILNYLIIEIFKLSKEVKDNAYYDYIRIYKQIYNHYNKLDDILNLYQRKFKKILSHAHVLFDNYYKHSLMKNICNLSESIKEGIRHGFYKSKRELP